jgi:hypothetical protein
MDVVASSGLVCLTVSTSYVQTNPVMAAGVHSPLLGTVQLFNKGQVFKAV